MSQTTSQRITGAPPQMRHVFTIKALTVESLTLEDRGTERLEFIPITGGTVSGELAGDVVAGGGDWCLHRSDDAYRVEARYGIRTTDGNYVDVVNTGLLRGTDPSETDSHDMGYFMTNPVFRTTAAELQWLTRSLFIGKARVLSDNTTIDVYEVLAD